MSVLSVEVINEVIRLLVPNKCYYINIIYKIYIKIKLNSILVGGKGNASDSGFYGGINFRNYGIPEIIGALSVRLTKGSLVLIAACSVRSSCLCILKL